MKRVSHLIKTTRLTQGTTLETLARFLDVREERLAAFENGESQIEAETLFGLVNALNIDPELFLSLLDVKEIDLVSDSAIELLRLKLQG